VRRPPPREFWLAGFLVLAFAAFAVATRGTFLATENLRDMGVNSAYRLIAGLGITMVILTAGIDISIGSGLALCCIAAGMLATNGMAIAWVVVGTLGAGALLGAVNAGGIALMRLPPIIMTLATLTIYRGVVLAAGGGYWITGLPEQFHWLGKGAIVGLPVPVVSAALLALGSHLLLRRTTFGRSLYAVGNNPSAARHLGVSEARTQWAVYTLSGVAVALAALAYATRFQTIQTNTGNGFEMVVITAVVVGGTSIFGGRGSVLGTVLGVALLEVVSTGLNYLHVPDDWLQAFQGGLVLLAVITDYLGSRASRRGGEDA
jgi:ribose/xylose/arabinose/galactoside ABC-type transport system permease subunit